MQKVEEFKKIKVGAVSYLNTRPLIYGLMQEPIKDKIILHFDTPSSLAKQMKTGELEIALLPVAAIADLNNPEIITDYAIAAEDAVASVCIFSEVPLNQISELYLDYESRTSNMLAQILLKEHWCIQPEIKMANPGYEEEIKNTTAGLIIGDRALKFRSKYTYAYDLSTAWLEWTGLPFVFAVWVTCTSLSDEFLHQFNAAVSAGQNHLDELAEACRFSDYDMKHYYKKNIQYRFDARKKEGLELFFSKLNSIAESKY